MPFTSCGGCLKNIFITEAEIIDRYVGNQLWNWGCNANGPLGDNSVVSRSSPVQTVSGGTNWKQVNGGTNFSAGIKTDGTLWLWGATIAGSLGTNVAGARSSPVQTVSGGTNWKQVSINACQSAAIKTDGTLWVWGCTTSGSLGTNDAVNRSSPVQTISAGTNWKQVSVGGNFTSAIKTDGTLWIWGRNDTGQLGNNSVLHVSSPIQTISGGTNWKQVSAGSCAAGAIKTDGTLWLWGDNSNINNYGLGDGTQISKSSPVQTVSGGTNWKQVSLGTHTAAIKTDGTLWIWGTGANGEMGENARTSRASPVQTVSGGSNWKQVSVAGNSTAAIKTDGTLWLWGVATGGRLGTNDAINRSSPTQTVSGGTNWKQVCGINSTFGAVTFTEA